MEPNRQIDQWDRMESPEIDPHKHSQLISDKGAKALCFDNGAKIKKQMVLELLDMCKKERNLDTELIFFIGRIRGKGTEEAQGKENWITI